MNLQDFQQLLEPADVRINGDRPWDIRLHDERTLARTLAAGSLGFGEAYMAGWWDCEQLDEFFARILRARIDRRFVGWRNVARIFWARLVNRQSVRRAFDVGLRHYDLGNDLFERMLDPRMVYSCAYWRDAENLAQAQEAKLDLICRKIGLQPNQTVLDVGCGWGSFARYAAERFDARVVGITISREQVELARRRCADLPVDIRLQDYRELDESFDHVVSIGMFEHVGARNYRTFMNKMRECLRPDGLMLLHTIGNPRSHNTVDPFMDKYIFPNAVIPSARQIAEAAEGRLLMEDWHNFGPDYDRTLMAWHANFERHWDELKDRYGDTFRRMWRYYLLSCAGAFRARRQQVWQIVFSRDGIPGGYCSIR